MAESKNISGVSADWKEQFFDSLFPIDLRVVSVPYALKRPSSRELYLDIILPDRKKTDKDRAFKLLENNIPTSLYKYRAVTDYALLNFLEDTIWIDNPINFNDPFDGVAIETSSPSFKDRIDLYEKEFGENEIIKKWRDEKFDEYADSLCSGAMDVLSTRLQHLFTVACLSEVNDSVLMWSHYANNHKGFCIEYSGAEIYNSSPTNKRLFPVKYISVEEQEIPVSALALDYSGLYSVLRKSDDWSYEREWRICFGIEDTDGARNIQLPRATSVYLGAKMTPDDLVKVSSIARDKGIPVYQEVLDYSSRKISFKPL